MCEASIEMPRSAGAIGRIMRIERSHGTSAPMSGPGRGERHPGALPGPNEVPMARKATDTVPGLVPGESDDGDGTTPIR